MSDPSREAARRRAFVDAITEAPNFSEQVIEQVSKVMAELDFSAIAHTRQVTSSGGVGTTALIAHLAAAGVDLPTTPDSFPFKHQGTPPDPATVPEDFRVVFLYDDPRDAAISIFAKPHFDWLRPMIAGNSSAAREALTSLEAYARVGQDVFGFGDFLDNWLAHPSGYPVMFIRLARLEQTWPEVAEFVGLPRRHPCLPMLERRPRSPALEALRAGALRECYRGLIDFVDRLPPALIVP